MSMPNTYKWDGLNEHLIAHFFEVEDRGKQTDKSIPRWVAKTEAKEGEDEPAHVYAPLSDVSMQMDLQWQSPFEDAGPQNKAPTIMAMAQTGAAQQETEALLGDGGINLQLTKFLNEYKGRTSITKLNSMQVFNGMTPAKISCTAHFRAWESGQIEVEEPFKQLMKWALPTALSEDGSVFTRLYKSATGQQVDGGNALMPSLCPTIIGMTYKGRTFKPLVIESIEMPLNSPINRDGKFIQLAVQLTLCTLTAIDRYDWDHYHQDVIR